MIQENIIVDPAVNFINQPFPLLAISLSLQTQKGQKQFGITTEFLYSYDFTYSP